MALYAAYGSNLDPRQMLERAPHSPPAGSGWLLGWRLTFGGEERGWDGPLATLVEDIGSQVFVMLYDVPAMDEAGLDAWEGPQEGLYSKLRVLVHTLDGDVNRHPSSQPEPAGGEWGALSSICRGSRLLPYAA